MGTPKERTHHMTNSQSVSEIIQNLTTVIEFAPAAKKAPEQLADMLCTSAEFRAASRVFRGLEPYMTEDEKETVKVDSPLDEQVAYTRTMLTETRANFEAMIPTAESFDQLHAIALESLLVGSREMVGNIQQLA